MKTILATFFLLVVLSIPQWQVQAANDFGKLEVPIGTEDSVDNLARDGLLPYLDLIIRYITVAIIIISVILVVIGGFRYMTAGGNADHLKTSKTIIGSALLGIALALAAYTILSTISTQFTSGLKEPKKLLQFSCTKDADCKAPAKCVPDPAAGGEKFCK